MTKKKVTSKKEITKTINSFTCELDNVSVTKFYDDDTYTVEIGNDATVELDLEDLCDLRTILNTMFTDGDLK